MEIANNRESGGGKKKKNKNIVLNGFTPKRGRIKIADEYVGDGENGNSLGKNVNQFRAKSSDFWVLFARIHLDILLTRNS